MAINQARPKMFATNVSDNMLSGTSGKSAKDNVFKLLASKRMPGKDRPVRDGAIAPMMMARSSGTGAMGGGFDPMGPQEPGVNYGGAPTANAPGTGPTHGGTTYGDGGGTTAPSGGGGGWSPTTGSPTSGGGWGNGGFLSGPEDGPQFGVPDVGSINYGTNPMDPGNFTAYGTPNSVDIGKGFIQNYEDLNKAVNIQGLPTSFTGQTPMVNNLGTRAPERTSVALSRMGQMAARGLGHLYGVRSIARGMQPGFNADGTTGGHAYGSDPFGYGGFSNHGYGSMGYGVTPGGFAGYDAIGNPVSAGSAQDVYGGYGGGYGGGGGGYGGGGYGGGGDYGGGYGGSDPSNSGAFGGGTMG